MRRFLLLLLAAVALVATGCGSDDDSSTSTAAASTPAAPADAAPANEGDTVTVEMKNIQFVPKDVEVAVGQTLKWVNLDSVDHDAVAESGADFKSDQFGKGGTFEWTADKPGKVDYVCTLHPGMVGTITVR